MDPVSPRSSTTFHQPQSSTATSSEDLLQFKDMTFVITGGAQGIGLATARLLLSQGARVSVADVDESALEGVRKMFHDERKKDRIILEKVDVSDKDSVERWMDRTVQWNGGPIDGAVNAAGVNGPEAGEKSLAETSDAHFDLVMKGMFHSLRSELNNIKSPGGSIVCISSVQGRVGFPFSATYSASKHAIIGMVASVAKEMGSKGIRVNTVAPGPIDTRMVAPKDRENILTPIKRLGTPDECAQLSAFLLSDKAGFITGATYSIDGGWAC